MFQAVFDGGVNVVAGLDHPIIQPDPQAPLAQTLGQPRDAQPVPMTVTQEDIPLELVWHMGECAGAVRRRQIPCIFATAVI